MKVYLAICAALLVLVVAGCAGHRGRIDCEEHLRPINHPAPTSTSGDRP